MVKKKDLVKKNHPRVIIIMEHFMPGKKMARETTFLQMGLIIKAILEIINMMDLEILI